MKKPLLTLTSALCLLISGSRAAAFSSIQDNMFTTNSPTVVSNIVYDMARTNASMLAAIAATNTALQTQLANTNTALLTRLSETNTAVLARLSETNTAVLSRLSETNTALLARLSETNTALLNYAASLSNQLWWRHVSNTNASGQTNLTLPEFQIQLLAKTNNASLSNVVVLGNLIYSNGVYRLILTNDANGFSLIEPTGGRNVLFGSGDRNSGPFGYWWYWQNHGGAGRPELLGQSSGSIALGTGQQGYPGNWGLDRGIQLCIGVYRQWVYLQGDWQSSDFNWGWEGGTNRGYSAPFAWKAPYRPAGSPADTYNLVGAQAIALDTNGMNSLTFFGNFDGAIDADGTNWNRDAWYPQAELISGGPVHRGQGLVVRGILRRERYAASLSNSNCPVDFNLGGTLDYDVTGQTNIYFWTTNFTGHSTNSEKITVILRASGTPATLNYPAGWNIATNYGSAPTTIGEDQFLRLEVESLGTGETNKFVTWFTGRDNSFVWDTDAIDWMTRASVTNAQDRALANMWVRDAKLYNYWTNMAVWYLMLKDVAAMNGENLKGNTFDISWSGSVAHTNNGVGFDGASYGNTGFNPTTHGYWSQNSAFMALYSGSTTVPNSKVLCGAASGATIRAYLWRNSNPVMIGLNNNGGAVAIADSDFSGLWIGNRTGSAQANNKFYLRGASEVDAGGETSTGNLNETLFIGARNGFGTADNHSSFNCRMFAAGAGMDATKLAAFQAVVNKVARAKNWPGAQ